MNNLNSVLVEGNLERDPELRTASNGKAFCAFSIVCTRWYKNDSGIIEEEFSYFDIEIWGKLAEACSNVGKEDQGCRVVGRLKQDQYWDNAVGKMCSRIVIVAEHVEFRPEFKKGAN